MKQKNITSALVLLAATAAYGYFTSQLPVRTLPNTPDPSFFPWVITALLTALSAALLVQGLTLPAGGGTETADKGASGRIAACLGLFIAYLVALPYLGFVAASILFFGALMLIFGERRPVWLGLGAVGVPLVLYLLFRYAFTIILPRGLVEGIIG